MRRVTEEERLKYNALNLVITHVLGSTYSIHNRFNKDQSDELSKAGFVVKEVLNGEYAIFDATRPDLKDVFDTFREFLDLPE